ncbi:MAG: acetyl-CoA decarbonylase/synthase complex subunit gamma, partial [Firmicutes bacterium]|nr:acetyl-CoA decarbonylase/synthase complex subunit gamma [Bacillota bacterium]
MGLTGLQIFKHLPKTNCKECGHPTCLAFAMALANAKISLDACPHVSEEAKEALSAASAPPIRKVVVGTGDNTIELGDETELFRHDKRFFHPTAIAIAVDDTEDVAARVEEINNLNFDRVGQHYEVDMVALVNASGDPAKFQAAAETVVKNSKRNLVLISEDPAAMEKALEVAAEKKPLIYAATADNYEKMLELAKAKSCPLAVKGENLDKTAELVEKITAAGYKDLVLDTGARETSRALTDFTTIRRLSIKKKFRPLGFPIIAFTSKEDPREEMAQATVYIAKYASIIVLRTTDKAHLLSLLSWRFNLYTDPQKPVQVEPGLYAVGEVTEDSPVYCTTNFSLTYFIVQGEVEATRIPSYILSVDTGGTSVLTSYA